MIQLNIHWPTSDDWRKWREDCEAETEKLRQEVIKGKRPTVKDLYKRKAIKKKYYFNSDGLFNGKCAYCETFIEGFQRGDIEHFRPKLGVTDENDVPVMIDYGTGPEKHRGYYWLSYDYQNLMPSCLKCNQASTIENEKIGKHNRFPILNNHAKDATELESEMPLLINPLVENPEEFIAVELEDVNLLGLLKGIDKEGKGDMTIKVLGLNAREHLIERRKAKIDEVRMKFISLIATNDSSIMDRVNEMEEGKSEYAAVVRATKKAVVTKILNKI